MRFRERPQDQGSNSGEPGSRVRALPCSRWPLGDGHASQAPPSHLLPRRFHHTLCSKACPLGPTLAQPREGGRAGKCLRVIGEETEAQRNEMLGYQHAAIQGRAGQTQTSKSSVPLWHCAALPVNLDV